LFNRGESQTWKGEKEKTGGRRIPQMGREGASFIKDARKGGKNLPGKSQGGKGRNLRKKIR